MTEEVESGAATSVPETRRDAIVAAVEKVSTPVEQPKVEATEKPEADTRTASERARDERGRFAAKQEEAAKAVNPDAVVEQKAVEQPKPSRKYPSSWKKDYEPVYHEVAANEKYRVLLDEVERRENDFHQGISKFQDDAKFAQNIRRTIAPFEATIRTLGVQPEQAIAGLLASDHALRYGSPAQKAEAVRRLFSSYGIDPSIIASGEPQAVDPNVQYLQQQLQQVQQQHQQFVSNYQREMAEKANAELESFKKDRPFFEQVRVKMGQLYQAGLATTLSDAYDQACRLDSAIQSQMLAEQQAKADAERKAKAQEAVNQAKSAAVQVKGAPSGASQGKKTHPKDRREALREAMNAVS